MTNGAYRESFDTALPAWLSRSGASAVTSAFPSMAGSGLPVRSNAWFDANARALTLRTWNGVATNALAYSSGEAVSFADRSVYADLRVRFDIPEIPPDPALMTGDAPAVFLAEDGRLVAVHAEGCATNETPLDTNVWYQLTLRLTNGTYDVRLNDRIVFSGLPLAASGSKVFASIDFSGTGWIDELYIGHGDPTYDISGPPTAIPDLPTAASNTPNDHQRTRINNWIDNHCEVTSLVAVTENQLNDAYLLDEIGTTNGVAQPVVYTFGISAIDMVSPTELIVTARLTANGTAKDGVINGRIQLLGKVNESDAWTQLDGAITPTYADFANGEAVYAYTIPADGYRFFCPAIVP
jgi:hypothetical protein